MARSSATPWPRRLITINPGQWFAKQFAEKIDAEKAMVQKSGYFSRSFARQRRRPSPDQVDNRPAVECVQGESGVIGHDEEDNDRLEGYPVPAHRGGKLDISAPWFGDEPRSARASSRLARSRFAIPSITPDAAGEPACGSLAPAASPERSGRPSPGARLWDTRRGLDAAQQPSYADADLCPGDGLSCAVSRPRVCGRGR